MTCHTIKKNLKYIENIRFLEDPFRVLRTNIEKLMIFGEKKIFSPEICWWYLAEDTLFGAKID